MIFTKHFNKRIKERGIEIEPLSNYNFKPKDKKELRKKEKGLEYIEVGHGKQTTIVKRKNILITIFNS